MIIRDQIGQMRNGSDLDVLEAYFMKLSVFDKLELKKRLDDNVNAKQRLYQSMKYLKLKKDEYVCKYGKCYHHR